MIDRLPLATEDPAACRKDALREMFPEAFAEGRIDFDRLKQALGEEVDTGRERFGLIWPGKSEAIRAIQIPSVATLKPDRKESVDFDTTGNVFIEGDNLEVLKLLQKPYHGRVKMIYIDPPYNTGNDFIYPDNFHEGLGEYLRFTGQVGASGVRMTTNAETGGRYHSKWLSMMYPRLFLARNLLQPDGVIFVSIDDHEVHNLRAAMNEIFGEENFIAVFVRRRRMATGMRDDPVSPDHEYVVAFAKSGAAARLFGTPQKEEDYPYLDRKGRYRSTDLSVGMTRTMRPNQYYPVKNPRTGVEYWPLEERVWRFQPSTMADLITSDSIIWPDDEPDKNMARPRFKTRYNPEDPNAKLAPVSTLIDTRANGDDDRVEVLVGGMNQEGTKELRDIFGEQTVDYPKPVSLMKSLVRLASQEDDIVLDFFAGSCTTAQAVLEQNRADGGRRRFIMVQLPEPTDLPKYPTIADIGRERIRHMGANYRTEDAARLPMEDAPAPDYGFKAFRLAESNFRIWDSAVADADPERLAEQLEAFATNVKDAAAAEDMLYEILVKAGLDLNAPWTLHTLGERGVYSIAGGELMVCVEPHIGEETVRAVVENKPQRFVCLDAAFDGNDALKTNTVLQMRDAGIEFRTV